MVWKEWTWRKFTLDDESSESGRTLDSLSFACLNHSKLMEQMGGMGGMGDFGGGADMEGFGGDDDDDDDGGDDLDDLPDLEEAK